MCKVSVKITIIKVLNIFFTDFLKLMVNDLFQWFKVRIVSFFLKKSKKKFDNL